ncbi:uncharacterized protein CBL_00603 [Carabus blaptoides fortunei]
MKIFALACFVMQLTYVFGAILPIDNEIIEDNTLTKGTFIGVDRSDVTFRLYTRQNPTNYIQLITGNLTAANIDPTKPFKFIIHGYLNDAGLPWVLKMKDAYLKKGDYNVIGVDWSKPALDLYPTSVIYTRDVGKFLGEFLIDLISTLSVPTVNIHLIGHSLGAHIAGFAGQNVKNKLIGTIGRITGMDPAGPLFWTNTKDERLSSDDADYVDVIHTDGGKLGYFFECGHADFYPEAGLAPQPGCVTRLDLDFGPVLCDVPITEDIHFCHYTRENPNKCNELTIIDTLSDKINRTNPWKFFIHGWTTSPQVSPWFHTGIEAYLKRGDYNIVFVDWSKPANQSYQVSVASANPSGKYLAKFINNLKTNNVPLENIHLLGHSLGSHMAGFAGKHVFNITGLKINRITALDPAGPLFDASVLLSRFSTRLLPENDRLSKNDANFVDVMHTDSGNYGMVSSIGHVDIFPNNGSSIQPGCENTGDDNCSHARSTHFYIESINSDKLIARKCNNYKDYINGLCKNSTLAIVGEDIDQNLRGDFYLTTNAEPPYGKGE